MTNFTKDQIISKLEQFLTENPGRNRIGQWEGKLAAAQQRAIFGQVLFGRKQLFIDPERREIRARVTVAFDGQDWESRTYKWDDLHELSPGTYDLKFPVYPDGKTVKITKVLHREGTLWVN